MITSLWSHRATGKQPAPRGRRRGQVPRLHLELLEDRCLLSFTLGPLVEVSSPDPLPTAPPGFSGTDFGAEPYVAVNPSNPTNIAAAWMDHPFNANAASVTFDGGTTWQNVPIPVSQYEGGPFPGAGDPWLSFAPNGDLYASSISIGVPVNKSTDGGLTWSQPIQVSSDASNSHDDDKPSITADPTNSKYVYATWGRLNKPLGSANNMATMFARSTDGGRTWEPDRDIHDAQGSDFNWGHQIVVLPNGTLIDAFCEGSYQNNQQAVLTLLRSTDHGQTWSAPIQAVVQEPLVAKNSIKPPNALVTDPNTGQLVDTHPMFSSVAVDRTTGKLYAVWIDARFSNFQYNGIALSMSTDGGFTWSTPIQVNQTPNTVPAIDRQAWNPAVAVSANGTVAVTYYDFRNNTPALGALADYWLAYSQPSASAPATNPASWGEVRLTNTSFNLEQAPSRTFFGSNFFLGDYEGLAAAGNDFVAVWGMPDGTATGQESIFFRRAFDPPSAGMPATSSLGPAALLPSDAPPGLSQALAGPFTATLDGGPGSPSPVHVSTHGLLGGDFPAAYDFTMLTPQPTGDPTTLAYTGESVLTTPNGTELFGMDNGVMHLGADGTATFTTVSIAGGTRKYPRATGRVVAAGTLDFPTGQVVGAYTGEIDRFAEAPDRGA